MDTTGEMNNESESESESESGGVADIAAGLITEMPGVSDHAIELHDTQERKIDASTQNGVIGITDKNGDTFDKSRHKANEDGTPKLTASGKLWLKPGARKSAGQVGKTPQASVIGTASQSPNNAQVGAQVSSEIKQRAGGVAAANMLIVMGMMIGGDEWQPSNANGLDEKLLLETAFGDYFVATGKDDIPPGVALSAVIVMYAAPRFAMPKTQQRTAGLTGWFKRKMADRKLKKHGLKSEPIKDGQKGEQKAGPVK